MRLYSAAPSSTDSTVFTTSTGDPLSTIIRAPFAATPRRDLRHDHRHRTPELRRPRRPRSPASRSPARSLGDPASGTINPSAVAVDITNSNILLDKDYIIDAGIGILVTTSGTAALTPSIYNDGIIGNIDGVVIDDARLDALDDRPGPA